MLQHTTSASAALASPTVSAFESRSPAHVRRSTVFSHHLTFTCALLGAQTGYSPSWFIASVPQEAC
eukprot:6392321-Prymnesium_polylepis.1